MKNKLNNLLTRKIRIDEKNDNKIFVYQKKKKIKINK